MAIVAEEAVRVPDRYELAALSVTSSTDGVPSADVRLSDRRSTERARAGDGRRRRRRLLSRDREGHGTTTCKLERYAVKAITGGTDAQGEVSCLVREDGPRRRGRARTPTSSWRARSRF